LLIRFVRFANQHKLAPHAWLGGLLYTHASTILRQAYLLGEESDIGWWYYFPIAVLSKSPTSLVIAMLAGAIVGVRFIPAMRSAIPSAGSANLWSAAVLAIPLCLYSFMLLTSHVDLGLRYALPLYPFVFIGIAVVGSGALRQARTRAPLGFVLILLCGLAIETAGAFPDYIAFFNTPASAFFRKGLLLLSDSNLDWGQDLPALARWRKDHPEGKLYLCYFGTADPAYYGIDYINIPGGYAYGPTPQPLKDPGYIAISAKRLQFDHASSAPGAYSGLWSKNAVAVLGGSIYIFKYP
jgi:hypothetical protein